jgi:hypothetical protein
MAAEAKIVITGDSTPAVAAIKRLNAEFAGLQSLAAKVVGFGFAGLSVAKLVDAAKAAADTGDELNKMAQKTGIAVGELSKLQYAADLAGVSHEALQKGLSSLAESMVSAATGSGDMAERYARLGITVRASDGTMKSSRQVLGELADRFAQMPDGVEKTELAIAIFGKKLGTEMIPLLNGGAAGLKELGDEAEAFGLVFDEKLAKASEEFNDNLEKLSKLSSVAGIVIANSLIPVINRLLIAFLETKKAGGGLWDSLGAAMMTNDVAARLRVVNAELEKANRLRSEGKTLVNGNWDDVIARLERQKSVLQILQEKDTGDGVLSAKELAAQRVTIERQLQARLAELAQLRAIAEGKVSSEILKTDAQRTEAQIANAKRVRAEFEQGWKASLKAADDATAEAAKLREKSADVKQAAADKAADKRRSTLTPEEQQADIRKQFTDAADAAESAANLAKLAAFSGRAENAVKLTKDAEQAAARAAKFADQIDDPQSGASAIERAAAIQSALLDAQAQAEEQKAAQFAQQAESQKAQITELDAMIADLTQKAGAIKVEADIEAAQGAIATLQGQLEALKDKTVTVTVNQVGSVPAGADTTVPMQSGGGYAGGGWTGPGGKWQPAGIVHADEFVIRQEVVRQRGVKALLARLNAGGLSALNIPGYADGGLVGRISLPSLAASAAPSKSTAVFDFGELGRYPVSMASKGVDDLKTAFAREALKRGGRR